ncbi:MAG: DUF3007 family protein [Gemmatimonadaceae bacterium]|nr:DUF3007 family protein [Gloeobacterales cyanobacterium ES-bin-141]
MRKIDILWLGAALLVGGAVLYGLLRVFGLSQVTAGIWAQAIFTLGLVAWIATYLFRVAGRNMTFNAQMRDYRQSVLQKRREEQQDAAGTPADPK